MRRDFDPEPFLARPLVAHVATKGPRVRPVWFLWEAGAFWWLTGSWSGLPRALAADARVALAVDTCDLVTGQVLQVRARGRAEVVPYDRDRARRKLSRYLGPDASTWGPRFARLGDPDGSARFVRLVPERLETLDLSYPPPDGR